MIFGEGKDEEIKKYVDGVFAKGGFLDAFSQNGNIIVMTRDLRTKIRRSRTSKILRILDRTRINNILKISD